MKTIPFHGLQLPAFKAIAWWKGMQDERKHARG